MRKKLIGVLSLLIVFGLMSTACGQGSATNEPPITPVVDDGVTPVAEVPPSDILPPGEGQGGGEAPLPPVPRGNPPSIGNWDCDLMAGPYLAEWEAMVRDLEGRDLYKGYLPVTLDAYHHPNPEVLQTFFDLGMKTEDGSRILFGYDPLNLGLPGKVLGGDYVLADDLYADRVWFGFVPTPDFEEAYNIFTSNLHTAEDAETP